MANRHQSVYHITLARQKKALEFLFIAFLVFLFYTPLLVKALEGSMPWLVHLIAVSILGFLLMAGAVVYLHSTYFFENLNTTLVIDPTGQAITIHRGRRRYAYQFSQVADSVLVLPARHKALKARIPFLKTPFSAYTYWYLRFHDGRVFVFTSLMIDYHVPLGLIDTEIVVALFPSLTGEIQTEAEENDEVEIAWADENEEFNYYALKYRHYTQERLLDILEDKHLDPERKQAIRTILSMRGV